MYMYTQTHTSAYTCTLVYINLLFSVRRCEGPPHLGGGRRLKCGHGHGLKEDGAFCCSIRETNCSGYIYIHIHIYIYICSTRIPRLLIHVNASTPTKPL